MTPVDLVALLVPLALLELPALLVQLALLVLRALQVLLVLPALELLAPILPLVATGPAGGVRNQLEQKVKVVQAMHERTAICADVQTEHVLCRQSLGIGRVNHVLRVHGHELARREGPLEAFDQMTMATLDRLFPGLTTEGHEQATLAASVGGLGWRRA